jgi:hypothetical protein
MSALRMRMWAKFSVAPESSKAKISLPLIVTGSEMLVAPELLAENIFYRRRLSSSAGTVAASRPVAEFSGFVLALGQSLCQCRPGQNRHYGS